MTSSQTVLPTDAETIAELRELYRAAESRAARLRLLSVSGRELAQVDPEDLDSALETCAQRLAFFTGHRAARLVPASDSQGLAIRAPGPAGQIVARLVIDDLPSLNAVANAEDRDAVRMQLELMGATIDRVQKERERVVLLTSLQDREKRLEVLLEKVFSAQEEERRRVSHELHDGVAQTATALVRLLESSQTVTKDEMEAETSSIRPTEVARGLVTELRRVIAGLRPTLLDDLGLVPALRSLAEGLEAEGYEVGLVLPEGDARLASVVETALFRVAQEAITNIRKHAGGLCEVSIAVALNADTFTLSISDTGRGPSEATLAAGGLTGHSVGIDVMRERMAALGGTLEWRAGEVNGVSIRASLPLKAVA
ncbi:MAG: ATP-binding protein [Erythrobacter sp.]